MKTTHLARAIYAVLSKIGVTQLALAQRAELSHASITKLLIEGMRPRPDTLRAICGAVRRPEGADILCGHLWDEIEKAGYALSEIEVRNCAKGETPPGDIRRALDHLEAAAAHHADVRGVILALSRVVDALPPHASIAAPDRQA